MRLLLFTLSVLLLLSTLPATAGSDLARARRLLGSEEFAERSGATRELWEAGPDALPVLSQLADDDDPEIARRARFVVKKIQLGLKPGASPELLTLIEAVERAPFESRSKNLGSLLEHPEGFRAALFFLDQWISTEGTPHDHRLSLSRFFVEGLFEQRSDWQQCFTFPLSSKTRAYLIGTLSHQDSPLVFQMVAMLASRDPEGIHQILTQKFGSLPDETSLALARLAVMRDQPDLARKILAHGLAERESLPLARALAFLETEADLFPAAVAGPALAGLRILRARAAGDLEKTVALAREISEHPLLQYESLLLARTPTLPADPDLVLFEGAEALPVWHSAFGDSPEEPDVEALTSAILIDWPELSRTLTALGHPLEAAEQLAAAGQGEAALTLLWHTGHREKAIQSGTDLLAGATEDDRVAIRGTLSSLALESGDQTQAAQFFEPLFRLGIDSTPKRQAAVSLALKIFPLEKAVSLAPDLAADRAFRRQRALAPFFDLPPRVAGFWYEYFREKNPDQKPAELIRAVRDFLAENRPAARKIIAKDLARSTASLLLPSDPLYQNALFLHPPGTLAMVEKAAWYQLSTNDLKAIIVSENWPLEDRRRALAIARQIDPIDPVLQWHRHRISQAEVPGNLTLVTLGDPALALALGHLTGKKKSLARTARVADFRDPGTLRCLALLGRFHLEKGEPEKAARLLLAALCGEMAMGTRPPAGIRATLQNLRDLYRARLETAPQKREQAIWHRRLKGIGAASPR